MIARFALVAEDGAAVGRLDVEPGEGPAVTGIRVDLARLARNDPGALAYPSGTSDAGLTAALMPTRRMLSSGAEPCR